MKLSTVCFQTFQKCGFSKKISLPSFPLVEALPGYKQPCSTLNLPVTSNPMLTCSFFLLNEQDMKDQMSNSSMQALAERKNRQVRMRNGQFISTTMSVLSGVPPLSNPGCGKGLPGCSQAGCELCPFGCPGRAGSHSLPASPRPLSEL